MSDTAVRDPNTNQEEVTLRLAADDVHIVADALAAELDDLAAAVAADISQVVGGAQSRKLHLADAAAKVHRQASIVSLLEQLGEMA